MKNHQYIAGAALCLSIGSVFVIGATCFIVSMLQVGLDQMPDASSFNITSFSIIQLLRWYVDKRFSV